MPVLFLAHFSPFVEMDDPPARLHDLARSLAIAGFEIAVITRFRNYRRVTPAKVRGEARNMSTFDP